MAESPTLTSTSSQEIQETQGVSGQNPEKDEENNTSFISYKEVINFIMNTPLTSAVNKLYEKTSYLDRYGGSLIVAVFTIICVSLFFSYSYLKNHSDVIKNNWQQNRCNPIYIPFAGMIINPKNMSKHEYATNNFFHCFGILLKDVVEVALAPIEAASILISASVSLIVGTMNNLMGAILYLRNALGSGFGILGNRSLNALTLLTKLSLLVQNSFNQSQGILVSIMYIFFTAYDMLSSFFLILIIAALVFLAAALAAMLAAWLLYVIFSAIPLIGWVLGPLFLFVAIGLTLAYVVILIMVIVVIVFTVSVIQKTS
jgi:hypothetical protein